MDVGSGITGTIFDASNNEDIHFDYSAQSGTVGNYMKINVGIGTR